MTRHAAFCGCTLRGIGDEIHLLSQHDVVYRPERTIERYLHRVLEWLIVGRLTNELILSRRTGQHHLILAIFAIRHTILRVLRERELIRERWLTLTDLVYFVVLLS